MLNRIVSSTTSHNKRTPLQKGKVYYIVSIGLICCGKSTLYNYILSHEQTDPQFTTNFKLFYINTDIIRTELATKYHSSHPEISYSESFELMLKETDMQFHAQLQNMESQIDSTKVNLILVDKNFPKGVAKFINTYCKDTTHNAIVLVPNANSLNPISFMVSFSNGKQQVCSFPYSMSYIIQCYLRLKHRRGHLTLNGNSEKAKYLYLSFLRMFLNCEIVPQLESVASWDNVYIKRIPFIDDEREIQIDEVFKAFCGEVLYEIKPFEFKEMKEKFVNEINEFFEYFDKTYDINDPEAQREYVFNNTIEDVKERVDEMIYKGV